MLRMSRHRAAAYFRRMTLSSACRIAAAVACLAALAGCAIGSGERVGAEPDAEAHVVTVLDAFGGSGLNELVDEVSRLSQGRLELRVVENDVSGPDYEAATIRGVQAGRSDLGVVGVRAWTELGAPGVGALGAPFLVDSYALQQLILTSDVTGTILEQLPSGFAGIGILPGPMRRPFGITHTLASPADFRGLTIGTQQSAVADETFRALGAWPRRLDLGVATSPGYSGLDGLELQVAGIENGRLAVAGSHLMTNVNLWPRALVVFTRDPAPEGLSADELQLVRDAAVNVVPARTAYEQSLEAETAGNLCRLDDTSFESVDEDELRALRRAVEPVYDELERDPGARAVIEAIGRIKDDLAEPPTEVAACSPVPDAAQAGVPTDLDGVWTMDTDRSAAVPDYLDENWGHWVFVLDRGRFAITQENATSCTWGYGVFALNGDRMSWSFLDGGGIAPNNATNRPGEFFVFDVSTYRDTLTLSPVEGEISPVNFRAEPWRRISETITREHFSTTCPPPGVALDRVS
jgi:TRAP-type transport system periplasmic protein